MLLRLLLALSVVALAGCATSPPAFPPEAAPQATACPGGVPEGTRCLGGKDSAGAFYLIALPADWNGVLVMHAHGGPLLGEPRPQRVAEDLQRWSIVVKAGYAWAGSSFRQGGVEVRAAAEDTERLRRLFVQHLGAPKRTLLHGQSWGASVAAIGAETYTAGKPYDAVLLSSGVLGGGTQSYSFRLDLRVVYQAMCGNHPRPDEAQYPLWMGLPADATLTQQQLQQRTADCLGLGKPAAQRTAEQQRKLKTIADVVRIPESSINGHLNWATFHFRDIAQYRSGGGNVFGNVGVRYRGSADDAALNAAVARYAADPAAVREFGEDTDPQGRIPVPVLTVHAIHDPVAFVELESAFRQTMQQGGSAERLVQVFTGHAEHSYLADAVYPPLLEALLAWADGGAKPTPAALAARCSAGEARWGAGCRMQPDYEPPPLASRVPPR